MQNNEQKEYNSDHLSNPSTTEETLYPFLIDDLEEVFNEACEVVDHAPGEVITQYVASMKEETVSEHYKKKALCHPARKVEENPHPRLQKKGYSAVPITLPIELSKWLQEFCYCNNFSVSQVITWIMTDFIFGESQLAYIDNKEFYKKFFMDRFVEDQEDDSIKHFFFPATGLNMLDKQRVEESHIIMPIGGKRV